MKHKPFNITKETAERIGKIYSQAFNQNTELSEIIEIFIPITVKDIIFEKDNVREITVINGSAVIYINSELKEWEQRFDLLHCVGHILFHIIGCNVKNVVINKSPDDDSNQEEIEANWFALAALMPKEQFVKLASKSPMEAAEHFKLPIEVIAERMRMLGMV